MTRLRLFALVFCLPALLSAEPEPVAIQLGRAAVAAADPGAVTYTVALDATLDAEAYRLQVDDHGAVRIAGGDAVGAMYGLQDLAEQLRTPSTQLINSAGRPAHPFRALKFNLPWDAYRSNEAITQHLDVCRDPAFWEAFLNMMAENRFNALTLWNLHPWPYLIRPTNFPEACPFTDPELAAWQSLFATIFRLAKERGIETYLVNWNIFVSPAFAAAHDLPGRANLTPARGATPAQEELVKRYNRESVTQVLNEYPDLTGIGFSLGEAMGGVTAEYRQQWVLDTVVAGVQAVDRPVKLIHRVPFSAGLSNGGETSRATEELTRAALESITDVARPILIEAKFNWSHAHSSPKLIKVHGGALSDAYANPPPDHFRMAWMMRNEDFFTLRWGEPDFIREVIARNSDPASVAGYFVGSECYVPALDYFTAAPPTDRSWTYAFERQWLFYTVWGRLLYDPTTPDATFVQAFADRYGADLAPRLFNAWRLASRVPLRLTSFVDINNDKSFYAEGFLAREGVDSSEFLSLEMLMGKASLDPAYQSIGDHVQQVVTNAGWNPDLLSPLALADLVDTESAAAIREVAGQSAPPGHEALRQELTDLHAWSLLGHYFAAKLRAGVALGLYQETGDESHRDRARTHIGGAIRYWHDLARLTAPVYREVPLTHLHYYEPGSEEWTRIGPEREAKFRRAFPDNHFSWSRLLPFVEADLDFVNQAQPHP